MIEKRVNVRKIISYDIENFIIMNKLEELSPKLLDMSEHGFAISYIDKFEIDTKLKMKVYIDQYKLEVQCRIIYSDKLKNGKFRTGLKFLVMFREDHKQLLKYLE